MSNSKKVSATQTPSEIVLPNGLFEDISNLILNAIKHVAIAVNAGQTNLFWNIGNRIRKDVLKEKRAEYGQKIISTLSKKLSERFGQGFSRPNLFKMVQFSALRKQYGSLISFPVSEVYTPLLKG